MEDGIVRSMAESDSTAIGILTQCSGDLPGRSPAACMQEIFYLCASFGDLRALHSLIGVSLLRDNRGHVITRLQRFIQHGDDTVGLLASSALKIGRHQLSRSLAGRVLAIVQLRLGPGNPPI